MSNFFTLPKLSKRGHLILFLASAAICMLSILLYNDEQFITNHAPVSQIIHLIGKQILFISIIYSMLVFLGSLTKSDLLTKSPITKNSHSILISAIFTFIMLGLWWIAGNKASFDFSVRQMEQIQTGIYEKAHPIFHTICCEYLLFLNDSWSIIIATQLILFSAGIYTICWWSRRIGLSVYYTIIAIMGIIVCSAPIIHVIIKDSPYISFFIIAMAGLQAWVHKPDRESVIVSTLGLIGVGVFRYDGQAIVIVVSCALALLFFSTKKHARHILFMCALPIAAIFSAHYVLPCLVNAKSEMVGTKLAMPAEIICEIIVRNGNVTEEEKEKAQNLIMPIELMKKHHSLAKSYEGQKYIWNGFFETEEEFRRYSFAFNLSGKEKQIIPLFLNLAIKNPAITANHLIQQSRMILDLHGSYRYPCSLSFYICIFALIIMLKHKVRADQYIPFVPVFACSLTCMFIATTFEWRYGIPVIAGAILLFGHMNAATKKGTPS